MERNIKSWFLSHARKLPWREERSAYRVWVSEMMLQQTQVSVVIPYFERWMREFPTIEALAQAPLEKVLKLWEGLGYYSRARSLHEGAKMICAEFGGELPQSKEALLKIRGIGPYTQGAIRSFAFQQKAAAVDGNVVRVLSRYFMESRPKEIETRAVEVLPDEEPWVVAEGLIELGATVCKKRPDCSACPIKEGCLAYRHQRVEEFPKKIARPKTTILHRTVAVMRCGELFAIQKSRELYEFPFVEEKGDVVALFKREGIVLTHRQLLPEQEHSFTRYRAFLYPHLVESHTRDPRYRWERLERLKQLPFSAGHKRVLATL